MVSKKVLYPYRPHYFPYSDHFYSSLLYPAFWQFCVLISLFLFQTQHDTRIPPLSFLHPIAYHEAFFMQNADDFLTPSQGSMKFLRVGVPQGCQPASCLGTSNCVISVATTNNVICNKLRHALFHIFGGRSARKSPRRGVAGSQVNAGVILLGIAQERVSTISEPHSQHVGMPIFPWPPQQKHWSFQL